MKRITKISLTVLALAVVVVTAAFAFRSDDSAEAEVPAVQVTRGDIVDKALAVGTIEPRVEIDVKSQVSGVVKRQYAEVGDFVQAGTPLIDIQPTPTPQELVDAERRIELRELDLATLKADYERQKMLFDKQLISAQEFETVEQRFNQATMEVRNAREQLDLLKEGKVTTGQGRIETVIRAPVSGFVLDKMIEIGDPVVPLTSYQEGTVLMTMANMNDLIFRGTVDEIDVGRLQEGMPAEIKVGALPNASVKGQLSRIWLKARKEENSTVFPVEIEITEATKSSAATPEAEPVSVMLRAGYSANTEIIIEQRTDALLIPERVIAFSGDTARVNLRMDDQTLEERVIQTGLSDAIHIEVVGGLEEGMWIAEKPQKEIQ